MTNNIRSNNHFYPIYPYATQFDIFNLERYLESKLDTINIQFDVLNRRLDTLTKTTQTINSKLTTLEREHKKKRKKIQPFEWDDFTKPFDKNNDRNYKNVQHNNGYNIDNIHYDVMGKNKNKNKIGPQKYDCKPTNDTNTNTNTNTINPFGTLGIISCILEGFDKKKKQTEKNNITLESEEEEISEYESDDEFEDLEMSVESIDDLIRLGKLYETVSGKTANTLDKIKKNNKINKIKMKTCKDDNNNNNNNDNDDGDGSNNNNDGDGSNNNNDGDGSNNNDDGDGSNNNDDGDGSNSKNKIPGNINILGNESMYLSCASILRPNAPKSVFNPFAKSFFPSMSTDNKKSENDTSSKSIKKLKHAKLAKTIKNKHKNMHKSIYEINGKKYSVNLETLNKLLVPLKKLKSMIGLDKLKNDIVDMILYYVQGFEKRNSNMLHTIIEGPPGVGKTEVGKIMAAIYSGLGIIPSNKFKLVKRGDLIGEYLGHTTVKTQRVIDNADGGVLFIDEAYALGNKEKCDSYAKECIDCLNQNLSENKKKFICIIAGYPDQLEKCFFAYNPGLKRRFPFRFAIEGYSAIELRDIFIKKVNDSKWTLKFGSTSECDLQKLTEFFKDNEKDFPNFGGDMENLFANCKFTHSRRVLGKHPKYRRKLEMEDIIKGHERFIANRKKETALSMAVRDALYS